VKVIGGIWRLACVLPLTPWPVVFYIQSFPAYSKGRHSAEPLTTVATHFLFINLGFSILSMIIILATRAPAGVKIWTCLAIAIHFFILQQYIFSNSVYYW
jgi:hypothetical protein